MRSRSIVRIALVGLALTILLPSLAAADPAERRGEIDTVANQTLDKVLAEAPKAKELFASAYGWAAFNNIKISLVVTGGGGSGVAVEQDSGERTYMRMGTAGLNIGLGGQKYQVLFLFQDRRTFERFVEKGWQAEAQASAAAGTEGLNKGATFTNGLAVFQITDKGLMLQADISGTKYWKAKKLNRELAE